MTRHVVMFSGGVGSFGTWRRVAAEHDKSDVVAVVANTLTEADDWPQFVNACHEHIGGRMVMLTDGRDLWELAREQRMIPNTRADFCSRILKREPLRAWVEEHCDPEATTVHLGFDWTEAHRLERARPHWAPWEIDAPLTRPPYLSKADLLAELNRVGIDVPKAYRWGMPHNNCLQTGCVKGGQAYWARLLSHDREAYLRGEAGEKSVRILTGKDVSILRDRSRSGLQPGRGPEGVRPLTLQTFRERIETQPTLFDPDDWGSCSCMEDLP